MSSEPKILCRTPTPGKQGTHIAKWRYDTVRRAILKAVPRNSTGVRFGDLPGLVGKTLPARERDELGSVSWFTTTVKLDLEVRGEIERVPGSKPQHLRRPRPA